MGSLPELRDPQFDGAGPGPPVVFAVEVVLIHPLGAARAVGGEAEHFAAEGRVGPSSAGFRTTTILAAIIAMTAIFFTQWSTTGTRCYDDARTSVDAAHETPTRDPETATVSFTLSGLERARDRGRLLRLASAEIMLAGVAVVVQGIRGIYEADRSLHVQPPRFRHRDPGCFRDASSGGSRRSNPLTGQGLAGQAPRTGISLPRRR